MMLQLSAAEWVVARSIYSILAIIVFIGSLANFSLVLVTIQTPSLRSTCHILIGICALLDGLHQIGPLYQLPVLFSDGVIDSFTCSALQLLPEMGVVGGCACVLSIGLERLTAVLLLTGYRGTDRKYLIGHVSLVSAGSLYAAHLVIAYYQPQRLICSIPAPYHGAAAGLWAQSLAFFNLSSIIVYSTTAIVISRRAGVSKAMRRAFRCIFLVMLIDVGGWTGTIATIKITHAINFTNETRFILLYVAGLFVNSAIAAKPLLYYTVSMEYRYAFGNIFARRKVNPKITITSQTAHTI